MVKTIYQRLNDLARKYDIESNLTESSTFGDVKDVYESVRKLISYPEKRALDMEFNKYVNKKLSGNQKINDAYEEVKQGLSKDIDPPKRTITQENRELFHMVNENHNQKRMQESNFNPDKIRKFDDVDRHRHYKLTPKKVITIVLVGASILTSGIVGHHFGYNHSIEEANNNTFVIYTVQKGDTTTDMNNYFYKYDVVKREAHTPGSEYSLYAGDEVLALTSDEDIENVKEKKGDDTIRLATKEELEDYYNQNKIWKTKKSVEEWMSGISNVNYVLDESITKKM